MRKDNLLADNQLRENIDWQHDVIPVAKRELEAYIERNKHKPTLRTLHYILLDNGTVPGTPSSYKQLSASIVKAKKQGNFPEDAFEDKTRDVIANFTLVTDYESPDQYLDYYSDTIKKCRYGICQICDSSLA